MVDKQFTPFRAGEATRRSLALAASLSSARRPRSSPLLQATPAQQNAQARVRSTIADVAPFTGVDAGPRPDIPRVAVTRVERDQQGRRCTRQQAELQVASTHAATRPTPCRPFGSSLRSTSNLALVDRAHIRRGCSRGAADQLEQDSGLRDDGSVGVRPHPLPVLLPAGSGRSGRVLRHGRDRPASASTTSGWRLRSATTSGRRRSSARQSPPSRRPGKLVANETLDLKATTFRTEAAKIISGHPDVILTEALGPAEAAFLSEVKQQNGGKTIPVIGTSATISPDWYKSVAAAVGASTLSKELPRRQPGRRHDRPHLQAVQSRDLRGERQGRKHRQLQHVSDRARRRAPLRRHQPRRTGDGRLEEHRSVRLQELPNKVATGKVMVHSFAQGLAALKTGQVDQLRRARRADEVQPLQRVERDLPDRHVFADRPGQGRRRTSRTSG